MCSGLIATVASCLGYVPCCGTLPILPFCPDEQRSMQNSIARKILLPGVGFEVCFFFPSFPPTCGAWFVTAAEGAVLRLRPSGSYPTGCSMLHTASCMSVQLGLLLSCMLSWLSSACLQARSLEPKPLSESSPRVAWRVHGLAETIQLLKADEHGRRWLSLEIQPILCCPM